MAERQALISERPTGNPSERRDPTLIAALSEKIRPGSLAGERTTVVSPCLSGLFPMGLQRGSTVTVGGPAAMSLSLALAAESSQSGGWVMTVGLPSLGLAAAAELGVALDRLVLVGMPPLRLWPDVIVTAGEGAAMVIASVPGSVRAADARRVQARLARSGAVLLVLGDEARSCLQPDLQIVTSHPRWEGIEQGSGRLLTRRIDVVVEGRRSVRPRRQVLLLPDAAGRAVAAHLPAVEPPVAVSEKSVEFVPLRETG